MRIRLHPLLALYGLIVALLASWSACLAVFCTLLVHELCHYLLSVLLGEQVESVELTPFGGVMTYRRSPRKGLRGLLIAAAGPIGNYILLHLVATCRGMIGDELAKALIQTNLAMLCVNMLPVLPLDGGQMVYAIGYYLFPVSTLIAVLTWLGVAAGVLMTLLALYGLVCIGKLNCSLLIVGVYLSICAAKSRGVMLSRDMYTIVQERSAEPERPCRARLYRVPPDTQLLTLIDPLGKTAACVFAYEDAGGLHLVGERQVCLELLRNPQQRIAKLGGANPKSEKNLE